MPAKTAYAKACTLPPGSGNLKRTIDLIVSVLGLLIASPVLLVLAVAVRLTSDGPAFFRQARVGRDEKPFVCLKLRTIRLLR